MFNKMALLDELMSSVRVTGVIILTKPLAKTSGSF